MNTQTESELDLVPPARPDDVLGKTARNGVPVGLLTCGDNRPDFTTAKADAVLFTRQDWTEFRDITRLPAKAGVKRNCLPRVLVKELVDNALDAGVAVEFGELPAQEGEYRLYVEDVGPGMPGTDEAVADFFSIMRPLASSKTRRMPTRGMLGNGLRVVAGVVLVGGGEMKVATRGRRLTLRPHESGRTDVVASEPWAGAGTRIEVTLRGVAAELAKDDPDLFVWADEARALAGVGEEYRGSSSPWWYGPDAFWEMFQAAGSTSVARVVGGLDGCTAKLKQQAIVGELRGRAADSVTRQEAAALLTRARDLVKPVRAERLGRVGERDGYAGYAREMGSFLRDGAEVPFVLEVWAGRSAEPGVSVCVNRTPVVTVVKCYRTDGMHYVLSGAGLSHRIPIGKKSAGEYRLVVNVIAPVVPLTSSGKDPDLGLIVSAIAEGCKKAVKRCRKSTADGVAGKVSQKDLILGELPAAAARQAEGGNDFSLRQLFYAIRPKCEEVFGKYPDYDYFARVIGEFEDNGGEVEGLYRDDRGTLYHPHSGESIPLGTRSVAAYQRPAWGFNKILYCEKEGFFPILHKARWPERHDCALLTSKGFASRAARDVLRMMGRTGEPITFYCVHDADGPGTLIFESLRDALEQDDVKVVNLGLDPAEGRDMGLQSEPVGPRGTKGGKAATVPTGSYLPAADRSWLQLNRIELNAMTTAQFLAWLTRKLTEHTTAKVLPPLKVVKDRLQRSACEQVTRRLTEDAIAAAGVGAMAAAILEDHKSELGAAAKAVKTEMQSELADCPPVHWSEMVDRRAESLSAAWPLTSRG